MSRKNWWGSILEYRWTNVIIVPTSLVQGQFFPFSTIKYIIQSKEHFYTMLCQTNNEIFSQIIFHAHSINISLSNLITFHYKCHFHRQDLEAQLTIKMYFITQGSTLYSMQYFHFAPARFHKLELENAPKSVSLNLPRVSSKFSHDIPTSLCIFMI